MKLHQSRPFLRAYRYLPHHLLNQACKTLMTARRPAWAVQAAIRYWIQRGAIDMADFVKTPYATVEDFFLRELLPKARPIGKGLVSPVDGRVVAVGRLTPGQRLLVKGQALSLHRLVNGRGHHAPLTEYEGGSFAIIFLSPDGYHHIHTPQAGALLRCQWVGGRYFPQNDAALSQIRAVYERNERAALFFNSQPCPYILVLVGASMVGGIELEGLPRALWARPTAFAPPPIHYEKGQRLGHFRFGSTVVLLLPRTASHNFCLTPGEPVRMGQPIGQALVSAV